MHLTALFQQQVSCGKLAKHLLQQLHFDYLACCYLNYYKKSEWSGASVRAVIKRATIFSWWRNKAPIIFPHSWLQLFYFIQHVVQRKSLGQNKVVSVWGVKDLSQSVYAVITLVSKPPTGGWSSSTPKISRFLPELLSWSWQPMTWGGFGFFPQVSLTNSPSAA